MKLHEYVEVAKWVKSCEYIRVNVLLTLTNGTNKHLGVFSVKQSSEYFDTIDLYRFVSPSDIEIIVDLNTLNILLLNNAIEPWV